MERVTYQEADEENVPYAIGLPIEEIIDPEPTIYHVNAVPYHSQSSFQLRPQIQYIPQHPNNRQHIPLSQPIQEPEPQEQQNKRSVWQRIMSSIIIIFGIIAVSIYYFPS